MSRMQREKGKRGERELADQLEAVLGCHAYRGRQFHGRPDAPDVATNIDGVYIEVKRCEKLSLYDALAQAERDCGFDVPIVCHRRNGKPWIVALKLDDLPFLYLALKRLGIDRVR